MKKILKWGAIIVVGLFILGAIFGEDEGETVTEESEEELVASETETDEVSTEPVEETAEEPATEPEVVEEAEDDVPMEYKSALNKAESYANSMHMSKQAVFDQLTSEYGEGFSTEAAEYAIENMEADFKANALEKANSYQENMSMSPDAIRDQLTSEHGEQFTQEEADYAMEHLAK